MANTFWYPPEVAETAIELAVQDSYLSALISRNFENDLLGGGGRGRVVNVRVPGALVARERGTDDVTTQVIIDSLSESVVPIELGTHAYSAVALSEGDLTLNLQDFAGQVLAPQVQAVVDDIEYTVIDALEAADGLQTGETLPTYDATNPVPYLIGLRRILRNRWVPTSGLNLVVGTQVYADFLASNQLLSVMQSGSTDALREGNVGQIQGWTVVEDNRIDENDIIGFHSAAFTLAVRAPVVPAGVAFGASESSNGHSLRWIRDYDATVMRDRSIVSTFAGVQAMPLKRIRRTYDRSSTANSANNTVVVEDVPGGAAIHLNVAPAGDGS
jgi:hypothetical protein